MLPLAALPPVTRPLAAPPPVTPPPAALPPVTRPLAAPPPRPHDTQPLAAPLLRRTGHPATCHGKLTFALWPRSLRAAT